MAVYTHLSAENLAELIAHYDVGELLSAKGIAEGVSNSNWLLDTTGPDGRGGRYILTMYERRIDIGELPFFLSLLDFLAAENCPVPATIHDRQGQASRMIDGKAIALIEFLPGVSVGHATPGQARAVGQALASIHLASAEFPMPRQNDLGPAGWKEILDDCGKSAIGSISDVLRRAVETHLPSLIADWPEQLPTTIIHADLFPDNVLMLGDKVGGLIDFYFACTDFAAYDLAVTHAAWCFSSDGKQFRSDISAALMTGYNSVRPLSEAEHTALPILAKGAAMRFIATRTYDWLHTPADALVTRKDPLDFVNRLHFYDEAGLSAFPIPS